MAGAIQTRISIYADDKASASFRKVAGEADGLVAKLLGMGPKVGDVLGNLGVGSLGLGVAINELKDFIKDSALAAGRYQSLGVAMLQAGENAGYNAAQMKSAERALVSHGISLQESRKNLVQLTTANVELAKSADLARMAQDLAVASNMNSSEAFGKLTHGLVSGQSDVLKNLGLFVNFQSEYAKAAQAMGKTAQSLTEAEKLQIRVNAAIQTGSRYAGIYEQSMGTAAKQLGSFSRHLENMQTLLGQATLGALSVGIFGVNDSLEGLNNRLMEMQESGQLDEISRSIGEGMRAVAGNIDLAAVALVAWYAAVKVGNSSTVERIAKLSKEHGVMATLRAEIAGNTAMLGQDTAAYIANTEAAIANHKARLAAINSAITRKQGVITEAMLPEHATDLEAIKTRKALERDVKVLQGERVIVTRQLTTATNSLTTAMARTNVAMRAMNGLKSGAMNLLNMFGGPWVLGLTAAAAAIYYIATADNRAEAAAKSYGSTLEQMEDRYKRLSKEAEGAALSTNKLTQTHRQAITEQNALAMKAAQEQIAAARKALQDLNAEAVKVNVDGFAGLAIPEYGNVDQSYVSRFQEIISALDQQKISALEAETRMRNLQTEMNSAASKMSGFFNQTRSETESFALMVGEAVTHVSALGQKSDELDKLSDAANRLAGSANAAKQGLADLASVNFDGLQTNVEFEIDKAGLRGKSKAMLDGLMRDKVLERGNVKIDGKGFELTGLTPEAQARVEKLSASYGVLYERQQAAKGGAKSLSTALSGLNNELARITMTEKEYARYQYTRKFAQMRKDLGANSAALKQWDALQKQALSAGFTDAGSMGDSVRGVAKAIEGLGLTEKEKQVKALNTEIERLTALLSAGVNLPFSQDQLNAYKKQRTKEITTGRDVEGSRQAVLDFEKEYLTVMESSEAAQILSIRKRAEEYEAAGAEAVRVAQWQSEMELRYSRDSTAGIRLALRNYASEAANMARNTGTAISSIFDSVANVFSFQTGRMKMDWSNMLDSMMNAAWKALVMNPLLGAMSKGLESLMGGFSNGITLGGMAQGAMGSANNVLGAVVAGMHNGGMVGRDSTFTRNVPVEVFAGAPRYHEGGAILRPGEVPIIAKEKERVLNERQNMIWEQMMNGGLSGAPISLTVEMKNESGQPLQAKQNQTQWSGDMRSAVIGIVVDAVNRNYMGARDALRG